MSESKIVEKSTIEVEGELTAGESGYEQVSISRTVCETKTTTTTTEYSTFSYKDKEYRISGRLTVGLILNAKTTQDGQLAVEVHGAQQTSGSGDGGAQSAPVQRTLMMAQPV